MLHRFMDKNKFSGENLFCVRGERPIFSELHFSINSGQNLVLQGPNGSGKSSLLRLMAGLLSPYKGQLTWNETDIKNDFDHHKERVPLLEHARI